MSSRQLRFRTGQIGAAGGPGLHQHTKVMKTATAAQYGVSLTTAGDTGTFDISQLGIPANLVSTTTFTTLGTGNNHPSEHEAIVAAGYTSGRVLASMYRFDVRFVGANSALKDFIFAYKFGTSSTAALTMTAGTVGIDNWKDMRQSRAWVWKRFSAINSGGSIYPSQGRIEIRIPSVIQLARKLFENTVLTAPLEDMMEQTVSDASTNALIRPFLHIVVMTIDGVAFAALDVIMDVTVYQTIRLYRDNAATNMIDEADQVS